MPSRKPSFGGAAELEDLTGAEAMDRTSGAPAVLSVDDGLAPVVGISRETEAVGMKKRLPVTAVLEVKDADRNPAAWRAGQMEHIFEHHFDGAGRAAVADKVGAELAVGRGRPKGMLSRRILISFAVLFDDGIKARCARRWA